MKPILILPFIFISILSGIVLGCNKQACITQCSGRGWKWSCDDNGDHCECQDLTPIQTVVSYCDSAACEQRCNPLGFDWRCVDGSDFCACRSSSDAATCNKPACQRRCQGKSYQWRCDDRGNDFCTCTSTWNISNVTKVWQWTFETFHLYTFQIHKMKRLLIIFLLAT